MTAFRKNFKRHQDGIYRSQARWNTGKDYGNQHTIDFTITPERKKHWRSNLYWLTIEGEHRPFNKHVFDNLADALLYAYDHVQYNYRCFNATMRAV